MSQFWIGFVCGTAATMLSAVIALLVAARLGERGGRR